MADLLQLARGRQRPGDSHARSVQWFDPVTGDLGEVLPVASLRLEAPGALSPQGRPRDWVAVVRRRRERFTAHDQT